MKTGIIICGLNGAGKSTLGIVLADRLRYSFIDAEELYFSHTDSHNPYAFPRTRREAEILLEYKIRVCENFVLATVKGNDGSYAIPFLRYAVLIDVPKEIRLRRIKERSFQKFGNRIYPGGDLYEQEKHFFEFAESRNEDIVKKWVYTLSCPIIRIDGTNTVEENTDFIIKHMAIDTAAQPEQMINGKEE